MILSMDVADILLDTFESITSRIEFETGNRPVRFEVGTNVWNLIEDHLESRGAFTRGTSTSNVIACGSFRGVDVHLRLSFGANEWAVVYQG